MRKRLLGIILFGAVALLAACGGGESTTPGGGGDNAATGGAETAAIKEGGIFRMGTTSYPDSINPFVGFSALSYIIWTETRSSATGPIPGRPRPMARSGPSSLPRTASGLTASR